MSTRELDELISAWLDGRIDDCQSQSLQSKLRESHEAREKFRELAKLDAAMRQIAGENGCVSYENTRSNSLESHTENIAISLASNSPFKVLTWSRIAIAATTLLIVSVIAYRMGRMGVGETAMKNDGSNEQIASEVVSERKLSGFATLRRVAGIEWPAAGLSYREGDMLPEGIFEFDDGVAEIDFFCGARLIVEGPSKMFLESDWSVRFVKGRLRANVPPAARGFTVKAADSEIIDLGTEFALDVSRESIRVEVLDGEIKLKGGQHHGSHLVTGESRSLLGVELSEDAFEGLSTFDDVSRRHEESQRIRFNRWKKFSNQLDRDDRLIAYYPVLEFKDGRSISNTADTSDERHGTLVGPVGFANGRFGAVSSSLEFDRPGARVRTRIDGEFHAFTFATWVRIDELSQKYNALFMSDGYENGEPHWQIRDDGRLMFSVMVDDSQEIHVKNAMDQKVVRDAGLHRVYFTEPIWDFLNSGQWFHLAVVYDPAGRQVCQYVNGTRISSEEIIDKFFVDSLRIGTAEIGNWGQPFRNSPWFAVRNLNGAIDELAIYNAALSGEEILNLYENGKPHGYE